MSQIKTDDYDLTVAPNADEGMYWFQDFLGLVVKGGPGSGHHSHAGRPGEVGGSKPSKDGGAELSTDERRSRVSDIIKRQLAVAPWNLKGWNYSFWFLPDGSIHLTKDGHWMSAHDALEEIGLSTDIIMSELEVEYLGEGEYEAKKRGGGFVPILEMLRLGFGRLIVNDNGKQINIQIEQPMTASQKRTMLVIYEFLPDYEVFYDVNTVEQYQGPTENYHSGYGKREFNRLMRIIERVVKRGGPGSGHFEHEGRPGEIGGSKPSGVRDGEIGGSKPSGVRDPDIPDDIRAMRFFHATDSVSEAESILESGTIWAGPGAGGPGKMAPVKGRTYATSDPEYALIYALGGNVAGSEMSEGMREVIMKGGRYGHIFEIDTDSLNKIQPDEDMVGEAVSNETYDWLNELAEEHIGGDYDEYGRDQLDRVMQGEYADWAHAGKQLVQLMTQEQKFQMIRDGASIANLGEMTFKNVWRIDKEDTPFFIHTVYSGDTTEKKREREDKVFELAEPVERGGPGSGHFEHEGRPGEVGGSLPSGAVSAPPGEAPEAPPAEAPPGKAPIVKPELMHVARLALKYDNFDDMSHAYSIGNYHGLYFHLTNESDFEIDPEQVPREGSSLSSGENRTPGLMVTTDIANWVDTLGPRPYVAIIELDRLEPDVDYRDSTRGFGHEIFIFNPAGARVVDVVPTAEAQKISDRLYDELYPQSSDELREIWEWAHANLTERGGPGSGHFEHEGREGKVGGSLPSGAVKAPPNGADAKAGDYLDKPLGQVEQSAMKEAAHAWPQTRPWERSESDYIEGKVPFFKFNAEGKWAAAWRRDHIEVRPRFFDYNETDKVMVLYHEIGHDIATKLLKPDIQDEIFEALDYFREPWGEEKDEPVSVHSRYHNFVGSNRGDNKRPEEFIADLYSDMIFGGESFWEEDGNYARPYRLVRDMAERLGWPTEPLWKVSITKDEEGVEHFGIIERGGPGSGHRGHAGRPGEVGGSLPGDGWRTEAQAYAGRLRNPAKKKYAQALIDVMYLNAQGFYPEMPTPEQVYRKGRWRPPDHEFTKIFRYLNEIAPPPKDAPDFDDLYAVAGDEVGGREIRLPVPNTDSISASFMDYEVLEGIRQVHVADIFGEGEMPNYYSVDKREATLELAELLKTSDWIEPLIVGVDKTGPWIVEGSHRVDALRELGEETFPAMIVIDRESFPLVERGGPGSGHYEHAGRPGEVGGSLPSDGVGKITAPVEHEGRPGEVGEPTDGGPKITIPQSQRELVDLYDLMPREGENYETRRDYFNRIMGNAFERAFAEAEALGDDISKMNWADFSGLQWEVETYKWDREEYPDLTDEQFALLEDSFVFGVEHVRQQVHDWAIKRVIAAGRLDPADAHDLAQTDAWRPQGREWEPLPDVLYHVTTAAEAVREEGLKSRLELGMWAGRGLGGGESDTISFTADLDTARDIDRALHEGRLAARGEFTVADMIMAATEGRNADHPYLGEMFMSSAPRYTKQQFTADEINAAVARDEIPERVQNWMDEVVEAEGERGVDFTWDFYGYHFASSRQRSGGPMYPLFFGTDYEALAASDPADFSILEYRPAEGAMGYAMTDVLGEWRTVGGDAVELTGVYEEIMPETEEELIGP